MLPSWPKGHIAAPICYAVERTFDHRIKPPPRCRQLRRRLAERDEPPSCRDYASVEPTFPPPCTSTEGHAPVLTGDHSHCRVIGRSAAAVGAGDALKLSDICVMSTMMMADSSANEKRHSVWPPARIVAPPPASARTEQGLIDGGRSDIVERSGLHSFAPSSAAAAGHVEHYHGAASAVLFESGARHHDYEQSDRKVRPSRTGSTCPRPMRKPASAATTVVSIQARGKRRKAQPIG